MECSRTRSVVLMSAGAPGPKFLRSLKEGIRDDLTCILDEDLSSHCLCALHCEMRNTEQMLKSVGLLAYEIGSYQSAMESLKDVALITFMGIESK
ncbi:hypothetical protein ACROYT_G014631 [Oculina patagonica]